ncbi:MAG: RNA 2',3'-cyclic phosphodiesterase [Nanoarchaeota archaeon]
MENIIEGKRLTRAFICLEFPDEVIKEVARVQESLRNKMFTGKFTELENLHLTLKFLGEIDDNMIGKVKEKLKEIKFASFRCSLGLSGTFSMRGNPRIVWIKLNGEGIWNLQKKIDSALQELFRPEERFMSHLTIARVKYVKDKKAFVEYVKKINVKEIKFDADCFKLKSSDLKMNGPVYKEIEKYKNTI